MKKLKLKKSIKIVLGVVLILLVIGLIQLWKEDANGEMETRIKINNEEYKITLVDNQTTKALLKKLPLEMTMHDLNDNEKYYYLDEVLPSSPQSVEEIQAGDIMLYGNNSIVIFYDTFSTYYKYTKIGHIEGDIDLKELLGKDDVKVTIFEGKIK